MQNIFSLTNGGLYGIKSTFYDSSVPQLNNMVRILKDMGGRVKIIHLTRDYYDSFISYLVDVKTGRGKDITDEQNLETLNTKVSFAEEQKIRYIKKLKERDYIIKSLAHYCPYLHVDYTPLYGDVKRGVKEIFRFLNVSISNNAIELSIKNLNREKKRLTMPLEHYIEKK